MNTNKPDKFRTLKSINVSLQYGDDDYDNLGDDDYDDYSKELSQYRKSKDRGRG